MILAFLHFNTSNVIFYLMANNVSGSFYSYFNTSNVIFYLKRKKTEARFWIFQYIQCYFLSRTGRTKRRRCNISIHPMLFFIPPPAIRFTPFTQFQYIQCYFLSLSEREMEKTIHYFNTSNVIFYQYINNFPYNRKEISIHPMLFFIYKPVQVLDAEY